MKRPIINNLPILVTIAILVVIYVGMRTLSPGDELGASILYFGILIPACGIFAGAWYGFRSRQGLKWIVPIIFFCLEVIVVCTSSGQMAQEDFVDYMPMGCYAAVPCLIAMVIGSVIRGKSVDKNA